MTAVRRIYSYLITLAALGTVCLGVANLVRALLEVWVRTPSATTPGYLQDQLALWAAAALVGLPIWAVHWRWAQRTCSLNSDERSSALRGLFLYAALTGATIVAWIALDESLSALVSATVATRADLARLAIPPLPLLLIAGGIWAYHWRVATLDRIAVGERGASATLRRWYMYGFAALAFVFLLDGTQAMLTTTWMRLTSASFTYALGVAGVSNAFIGVLVWSAHWAWLPRRLGTEARTADQRATLRSVYLFVTLAVVLVGTLSGLSQGLYYALARLLGVDTPGGVGGSLLQAAAGPASVAIVYGAGWFYQRRIIARFGAELETQRQTAVRRVYQYLTAFVALAILSVGVSGMLWMLGDVLSHATDAVTGAWWRDRLSLFSTLTLVGLTVWLAHWQPRLEAEANSLARRIYLYVSLSVAVLALLGSGAATVYRLLSLLLGAAQSDWALVDMSHTAAIALVAAGVAAYQWRVVRMDTLDRPRAMVASTSVLPDEPEGGRPMRTDRELQLEVQRSLAREEHTLAADVGVTVADGVVALRGIVPSFAAREAAEAAALAISDVRDVANEIAVQSPAEDDATDEDIAANVRHALEAHFGKDADHVKSIVSHGVVALQGSLRSWHAVAAAEQAVGDLPDVKDVVDELVVQ